MSTSMDTWHTSGVRDCLNGCHGASEPSNKMKLDQCAKHVITVSTIDFENFLNYNVRSMRAVFFFLLLSFTARNWVNVYFVHTLLGQCVCWKKVRFGIYNWFWLVKPKSKWNQSIAIVSAVWKLKTDDISEFDSYYTCTWWRWWWSTFQYQK